MVSLARDRLISFFTSDWLELAPDVVSGVESSVRVLSPGVSIGEARPSLQLAVPRAHSSASNSSAESSPVAPPPISATPSPSSGNDADRSPGSHANSTTPRPAREAKRVTFRTEKAASAGDSPPPSTPSVDLRSIVGSRRASRVAATAVSAPVTGASTASTPASTASVPAQATAGVSTRSSKRRAAGESSQVSRPTNWSACSRCKMIKKGCSPSLDADPPYSACTLCVRNGDVCIRDPDRES